MEQPTVISLSQCPRCMTMHVFNGYPTVCPDCNYTLEYDGKKVIRLDGSNNPLTHSEILRKMFLFSKEIMTSKDLKDMNIDTNSDSWRVLRMTHAIAKTHNGHYQLNMSVINRESETE